MFTKLKFTIPRIVIVTSVLGVLMLPCAHRVLANDSVMGAGLVSVPQASGDPLKFEFSVAAVGPGGGASQGTFRARIHDPAGDIDLVSEIQSVGGPPNGSRIVLGGLGSVEQNGFGQTHVPWHLSVVQNQGGVEATLSVTSSLFGHISHSGTITLGSIERTAFPSGIIEAVACCDSGDDVPVGIPPPVPPPTEFMTFSLAAFVGATPSDGYGTFSAVIDSADCPDIEAVMATFDEAEIRDNEFYTEFELCGQALVYLSSDPNTPVSREVRVTHYQDFDDYHSWTTLEIIGIGSGAPVECTVGISTADRELNPNCTRWLIE